MLIGVGRAGWGEHTRPPIIREGGEHTLWPPIIHPHFPLISNETRKKSQMYQVEG